MAHDPSDIREHSVESAAPRRTVTLSLTPKLFYIVLLVLLCGLSFWAGEAYQKSHNHATTGTFTTNGGFGARRAGGVGTVTAISDTSIAVQNQRSGATKTYTINSSTTITDNGQTVSSSDIQTGDTVLVRTSGNSSTVATQILVNPGFGGGQAPTSGPSTTTD